MRPMATSTVAACWRSDERGLDARRCGMTLHADAAGNGGERVRERGDIDDRAALRPVEQAVGLRGERLRHGVGRLSRPGQLHRRPRPQAALDRRRRRPARPRLVRLRAAALRRRLLPIRRGKQEVDRQVAEVRQVDASPPPRSLYPLQYGPAHAKAREPRGQGGQLPTQL